MTHEISRRYTSFELRNIADALDEMEGVDLPLSKLGYGAFGTLDICQLDEDGDSDDVIGRISYDNGAGSWVYQEVVSSCDDPLPDEDEPVIG